MANKMDKLSSNNLIIVMVLLSLMAVGVTVLVSRSLYKSIALNAVVVQKKTAADNTLKQDITNAPSLITDYTNLGDKKRLLADALPSTVDFPSILVTLENITGAAGQKLKSITPASAATSGSISAASGTPVSTDASVAPVAKSYTFGITTAGNYDGMVKMLHNLETSARPMRIVDAQFAGGGSTLASTFTIQTFYQDAATLPLSTETVK